MRLLTAAGIAFSDGGYEFDEINLSGVTRRKRSGMPPEQVFKTL
jgi:prolyl-tRNA editing enzyme YbaK/EbsC (Cys-tRNA(Pro) deacylase)